MGKNAIEIEHVYKEYRLGAIGGGTLRGDLQSWMARMRGKEDPNVRLDMTGTYGERFLALNDVSFSVKPGEAVGIIGHNGAGKSTLLKLLSRVTAPTKGKISFDGRIASMLEVGTGFHPELTGRENVYMNGAILGMTKAEITKKFDQIVEFAEMQQFIDTPVKRYSSGMYVKLAFAVAAHLDSEIMIMDEVLAVGDVKFQQKCLGRMGDAAAGEGRTVLYVSHNMSTIRQLCERCIVLDHGKLIYDGDTERAIEIYSECAAKMEYHYEYSEVKRRLGRSRALEFVSLDILNSPDKEIKVGDMVHVKLRAKVNQPFKDLKLRFEISYGDNTIDATMFSKENISADKVGDMTIDMDICTEHMTPGLYRFDMIVYEYNEFGGEQVVDKVGNAFRIELVKKNLEDLEWKHQFWGHIQLESITINDIKK